MPWDSDKSTAADPDNPAANEQLTADEWDQHVTEGHWPGDELNLSINGNGDPVITDPKNGDQEVMRYDRSAGTWVVSSFSTDYVDFGSISERLILQSAPFNTIVGSYQVSTSDVNILSGAVDYFAIVRGRLQGDNITFVDLLIGINPGTASPKVVDSYEFDSPAARTYGNVSSSTPMRMASGTYDVQTICFVFETP